MSTHTSSNGSDRIYRIDKFNVPDTARQEFMERVYSIHEFLRTLPGFVWDAILEQSGGPGEFNIVTIAVWDSPEVVEAARKMATARYEEIGFNPQELITRLGIKADMANYQRLAGTGS